MNPRFQYSCIVKRLFDVIFPFILPMISTTHSTGPQPFVFRFVSFVPCSWGSSFFKLLGKKWEKIETDKKESSCLCWVLYCNILDFVIEFRFQQQTQTVYIKFLARCNILKRFKDFSEAFIIILNKINLRMQLIVRSKRLLD